MAISVAVNATVSTSDHKLVFADVTLDSSYPTGGEAVTPEDFGLQGIVDVFTGSVNIATKRALFTQAGRLLKLYVEDGTSGIEAEAANASDQSAVVVPVQVIGY